MSSPEEGAGGSEPRPEDDVSSIGVAGAADGRGNEVSSPAQLSSPLTIAPHSSPTPGHTRSISSFVAVAVHFPILCRFKANETGNVIQLWFPN